MTQMTHLLYIIYIILFHSFSQNCDHLFDILEKSRLWIFWNLESFGRPWDANRQPHSMRPGVLVKWQTLYKLMLYHDS